MNRTSTGAAIALGLALLLASASPTSATNGMYLEGYGAEASGRGGANIAVADRALGLQANPAGIAQLQGNHYNIELQILMPQMSYSGDPFGNNLDAEDRTFFMPSFSYVRGGGDTKWTWGIGLISQGGMGATFKGYNTPFGTQDQTYSQVRFATINPTVAYSFNDDLSIGLSANLGYSDVEFRFWPETSFYQDPGTPMDPSDDIAFFGANLSQSARAFNYSARLGLLWRISPRVQLGAVYQTKTEGDYEDGTLALNMNSIGLGTVSYDARVDGFTWPEQYGLGLQLRPGDKWIVAIDAKRYMWSNAVSLIEVRGSAPNNAMAPSDVLLPFTFVWEDQTVLAAGAEYRFSDRYTIRAGVNHGDSPVPDETLNPLFPATVEDHATLGLGVNWGANTFNFAISRGFEASQTNRNMNQMVNPFGPGATVDHSQWTLSFGFSRAFARGR